MKRGRPFEAGNKCGRGRPRGSRNKATLINQEFVNECYPALMRKTVYLALQGDVSLLRMFAKYGLERLQESLARIGPLPMGNIEELLQSHQTVMNNLASGGITLVQATQLDSMLETRRGLIVTQDLVGRMSAMEKVQESHQPG